MLDGFLLFCVLDVWRVLLPLGLSILCVGTFLLQHLVPNTQEAGLGQFLCLLSYRVTTVFVVISILVGILVPWLLGYVLPERHLAEGPWSYEEMCSYVVGLGVLWRLQRQVCRQEVPSVLLMTCPMILFAAVGFFWIGRWDVMANGGQVLGGWWLGSFGQWEWSRLIPKSFHLLFSAIVTGGMLVAGIGLLGILTSRSSKGVHALNPLDRSSGLVRYGVGWILFGVVPQMLIGPWLFLLLQKYPQLVLTEGVSLTSLVFFVSLTAALMALVLLNASFMAPYVRGLVWGGLGNVALTLSLMGIVRYETFASTLLSHNIPSGISMLSGWHILSVFALLMLLGAILYRWCVWPATLIFNANWPTAQLDNNGGEH